MPNQFAWKPWFMWFVFESSDVKNIFWIDSGIVAFGIIRCIFEHINKNGYLLTEAGFTNYNFTHDKCKEIMNVTDKELEGNQLLAGLTGFNKDRGLDILHKWCYFCSKEECVTGIHWLGEPVPLMNNGKQHVKLGHRHDQTILSILRVRYNLPTVQKT